MSQVKEKRKVLKNNKVYLTGAEKACIIEALKLWAREFEKEVKQGESQGMRLLFAQGWATSQSESIIQELEDFI